MLNLTWDELGELFNKELRSEDEPWWDQSAYRKPYQQAKSYYENVFSKMIGDEYSKNINKQMDELRKLKQQFFDQRREYNKLLVSDGRSDHLVEYLKSAADRLAEINPLTFYHVEHEYEKCEAVLCLSDWHYGMVTNNIWNTYNTEICKERVSYVVSKTATYLRKHRPETLHVVLLGDFANGSIHTSVRVASEEDTCDQLMQVSEILAESIGKLAGLVKNVKVYSTYGNHMRTVQNKKDSIYTDNMERIIPWWLGARLGNFPNIEIINSEYREFIKFTACGYNLCAVHGDLDNIKNFGVLVNTIFTKLYGETIEYTISGDKHHMEEFEALDIESILVRSLCGTDNYANDKRLYSKSGQTLMFFTPEDGRQCTYNISKPL